MTERKEKKEEKETIQNCEFRGKSRGTGHTGDCAPLEKGWVKGEGGGDSGGKRVRKSRCHHNARRGRRRAKMVELKKKNVDERREILAEKGKRKRGATKKERTESS